MTSARIIRIEKVRFDFLSDRFIGTAICREANGVLTRHALSAPGDPTWDYGRATNALAISAA
ncbi:MAG: hypothetical protein AAF919_00440 [Pseudomonadota bacterium]